MSILFAYQCIKIFNNSNTNKLNQKRFVSANIYLIILHNRKNYMHKKNKNICKVLYKEK